MFMKTPRVTCPFELSSECQRSNGIQGRRACAATLLSCFRRRHFVRRLFGILIKDK